MFEWHVLRQRYDVSYLPAIALHTSLGSDLMQLPESAAPFFSRVPQSRRSQAAAALQTSFPQ